jgi:uroporphyrinogen III methyltransferase/synthase
MGVKRTAQWSRALIEHGKPPETPVAIVRWCTRPKQEMVHCTLGTAAQVVEEQALQPPAVFIVGDVVDRAPQLSWFAARMSLDAPDPSEAPPDAPEELRDRLHSAQQT